MVVETHPPVAPKKRRPARVAAAPETLRRCRAAARAGRIGRFYLAEGGFANLPNVQRAWSPTGQPHEAEAGVGRQRAKVVGALDDATGQWWHDVHDQTIRREGVVALIDRVARRAGADALTLVVLDNASMHPAIDPQKREDGLVNHRLVLRHRPPYSPALNLSERVWKPANYHWRRFVTWAKEPVREEVVKLMQGFGSAYQISFA